MSTCCDVAFGPYRTLGACNAQVRLWRLADIPHVAFDVAFGGKADMKWHTPASRARVAAGAFGFLTLIHALDGPER
jgi:hypothetical protein